MYEMVVGEPPYYSDDIPTMYKNIREGILKFPSHISDDCKNCIKVFLEFSSNILYKHIYIYIKLYDNRGCWRGTRLSDWVQNPNRKLRIVSFLVR